jgi:hypothetical protein
VDVDSLDGRSDIWIGVLGCTGPNQQMFTSIPAVDELLLVFAVDLCRGDKIEILGKAYQEMF